jgi:hypothetical protein
MGRTLVFLARIVQDGWSTRPRAIAVDERSALLVEPDGKSRVIGPGRGAYFIQVQKKPSVCRTQTPLSFNGLEVYHVAHRATFDIQSWTGFGGDSYSLAVDKGTLRSARHDGAVY